MYIPIDTRKAETAQTLIFLHNLQISDIWGSIIIGASISKAGNIIKYLCRMLKANKCYVLHLSELICSEAVSVSAICCKSIWTICSWEALVHNLTGPKNPWPWQGNRPHQYDWLNAVNIIFPIVHMNLAGNALFMTFLALHTFCKFGQAYKCGDEEKSLEVPWQLFLIKDKIIWIDGRSGGNNSMGVYPY